MNRSQYVLGLALGIAAVSSTLAAADPNPRFGIQMGSLYAEYTLILVQPGTRYELHGAIGDHDIYFLDANYEVVGWGNAYGPESGTVPPDAVRGLITMWDGKGEAIGPISDAVAAAGQDPTPLHHPPAELPGSLWVYIDGL